MRVYLRLNVPREIEVAKQYSEDLDGFVIEAHIFEVFKKTFSDFLALKKYNTYMVDPVVYKFGLKDIVDQVDKAWYQNLVNAYHLGLGEERPFLSPNKVSDAEIKEITEHVIRYQYDVVHNELRKAANRSLGLLQFLSPEEQLEYAINPRAPIYLIPPYLIIEDTNEAEYRDYLEFNIKALRYARRLIKARLLAVIPIGDEILRDRDRLREVLKEYLNVECDAYGIWVAGLNEATDVGWRLGRYVSLLLTLKAWSSKPVINLYGGYFSIILSALDILDGVVFGVGYAEYRDPRVESGPVATTRYYNPLTHTFESIKRIRDLYRLNPKLKCQCKICREKTPDQILNLSLSELLAHFMENRIKEKRKFSELRRYPKIKRYDYILEELKEEMNRIEPIVGEKREERIGDLLSEEVLAPPQLRYQHLEMWRHVIEELKKFEQKRIVKE